MIMQDAITNLILKSEAFLTTKGQDITVKRDMIEAINTVTDTPNLLDAIYVNHTDHFNIPNVVVLPMYHKDFSTYLMDGDLTNVCPFGYTVEIHQRVFETLSAEELTAALLHDILQNVMSCTAKVRFLKAYNYAISEYRNEDILDIFKDVSISEIMYMAFVDICCRPFMVPAENNDLVATDEVLRNMKLADAYDAYLEKVLPMSQDAPEDRIVQETKNDFRTLNTIMSSCRDKDIRHYYTMIKNGVPLISLENVFCGKMTLGSLGFIGRSKKAPVKNYIPDETVIPMTESYINPKSEIELRFQVDKIIGDIRYVLNDGRESDREVILTKIKNLSIKLTKQKIDTEKELKHRPDNEKLKHQLEFISNLLDELEMLRDKVLHMEIKEKRYGVFVKYPQNYTEDFAGYNY